MQTSQQPISFPQGGMLQQMQPPQPHYPPRTWHADQDVPDRHTIMKQIVNLFQTRKPEVLSHWNTRIPEFLKKLEEALYRNAKSKQEYTDLNTLEQRLQTVARSLAPRPAPQQSSGYTGAGNIMNGQMNPMVAQPQMANTGFMNNTAPSQSTLHQSQQYQQLANPGLQGFGGMVPGQNLQQPLGADMRTNAAMTGLKNPALAGPVNNVLTQQTMLDGGGVGMSSNSYQQPMPMSNMAGNNYGAAPAVMPNGAPIIRNTNRDTFGSPNLGGSNLHHVTISGVAPGQLSKNLVGQVPQTLGSNSNGVPLSMATSGPMQQPQYLPSGVKNHTIPMPQGPVGANVVSVAPSPMVPVNNSTFQNPTASTMPNGLPPTQPNVLVAPGLAGLHDNMSEEAKASLVQKQQRWLLFLRHCAKCRQSEQECQLKSQCKFGKTLWQHILACNNLSCEFQRCKSSKELLKHHQKCLSPNCMVCAPVKDYVKKTSSNSRIQQQQQQQHLQLQQQQQQQALMPSALAGPPTFSQPSAQAQAMKAGLKTAAGMKRPHEMMVPVGQNMQDSTMRMIPVNISQPALPTPAPAIEPDTGLNNKRNKTEDLPIIAKNTGTSLLETFSEENIRSHVASLRAAAQQANKNAPPPNPAEACSVCQQTRLLFEPPCIYCSTCGQRIKRTQVYYCTPTDMAEMKGFWCHACYSEQKGDKVSLDGSTIKKAELQKKKNDEEIEEAWVQCDECEVWVHQICALFNKGRNSSENHYLCPDCLLRGLTSNLRKRIEVRPQSMLESKDLPTCKLSSFLELRVQRAIENDKIQRAHAAGKNVHEVPAVEGLTIRVVNSVVKKCEVKQKFQETFQADGYPTELPYRQKVVLLFQNHDGVDVCLFCMYVQEYGDDCPMPNKNCVYLSYLDSVKYFKPEINAANSNVALRTFVYHQILIGYLQYAKALGFEQMYIWACPPLQGDDYILYCHPAKQKTPRSDRLRQWYLDMLKKAKEEKIVAHVTTLWDTYFEGGRDHRIERCSATHIPYLEGDYWPGEAENLLQNMSAAERQSGKNTKKGAVNRKSGAKGKRYGAGPATTDETLMARLSEILGGNMKEDFIVAHLVEPCTFCRAHVDHGMLYRYFPPQGGVAPKSSNERKFEGIKLENTPTPIGPVTHLQLCANCYKDEEVRNQTGQKSRLPAGVYPFDLVQEKIEQAPKMRDMDGDIESEFFETRQAFLSLCQGNHYQFDTLRRAKHSSMMCLYHLHNPSAPAFACTCNVCNNEIEPGAGFRCTVCTDFDICSSCKQNINHEHPLMAHVRKVDETRTRLTEAERRERAEQLQRTMQLLVHACSCNNPQCGSSSCRKVRQLFQHAVQCQLKVTGGCQMCKKMWCLLNLHAKGCTRADCPVPRCRELKELRRRQTARQEEQRRQAYQLMLRQQNGLAN